MAEEKFLAPYFNFPGTAEEAMTFYKNVIGGEILGTQKFGDTPHGAKMSEVDQKKVMHMALRLPDGSMMMASDHLESMGMPFIKGTNVTISLHPITEAEADRLYNGLSDGGNAMMPMQKTFWNAYFGMLEDKYGIQWMVNYTYPAEKN